jgi:hypothetical protein
MQNERWFKFDKKIDFAHCGPVEEAGTEARRHEGTKGKNAT